MITREDVDQYLLPLGFFEEDNGWVYDKHGIFFGVEEFNNDGPTYFIIHDGKVNHYFHSPVELQLLIEELGF